jgi:thioesterase domain-containing protein
MESIEDRAKFFINEMRALQPQGPYHLIGFCGGGYIAYEMAQRLSAEGHQIGFLGIVDCVDPHYPHNWEQKLRFNAERAVWRVRRFLERSPMGIARWFIDRSKSVGREFGSGSLRFRDRILGRTRSLALNAPKDLMAKAWRNAKRYYPTTYGGGCTVFIGKDSYEYAGLSPSTDPRLVWCRLSMGGSEVRAIPGDHLKMLEAPNMYEFAEQLKGFLA